MCQPYRSVGDSERALATPPGADHDGVVSLHGDDSVKLQDAVSVRIAVRGRVDVLGVRAGMSGELLLPVDHAIVGSEMPCHTPPLAVGHSLLSSEDLARRTEFNPNSSRGQQTQAVQSNASSAFTCHQGMSNFNFLIAFSRQDFPSVLPKRIPKFVIGMAEKFHVDLH